MGRRMKARRKSDIIGSTSKNLKSGSFITNGRLTSAFTSIKNMFSKKIESKPYQAKRKFASNKDLLLEFASPPKVVYCDEVLSESNIGGKKKKKEKNFVEPSVASASVGQVERFLSDLESNHQDPVPNCMIKTPVVYEKAVIDRDALQSMQKNRTNGFFEESQSEEITVEMKKFHREVFTVELSKTWSDLPQHLCNKDLAAEKKKKISKAYYENEAERTLYIQQKLVEETEEIVSDSPRVDKENEVASCCDPLDFLTNFQASVHQPFPLKDLNSTNSLTNDNSFVGFPCVDIKDGENSICNEIDLNYLPRSAYLDVPGSAYPYREWSTGVSNSVQFSPKINTFMETKPVERPFQLKVPEIKYFKMMRH
ncbi:uncharacterized protein LOC136034631 [Artemia franciscana]|uniref:uncharacterized protein LOC136034631 n=1 Tax=Artemia franciscana TaxID=6661 RepID=UPI0032DAD7DC